MLIEFISKTYRYHKVKSKIKEADKMKALRKKKMYVIQIYGKIRVYDREHINKLIFAGVLHKKLLKALELDKACIYVTK